MSTMVPVAPAPSWLSQAGPSRSLSLAINWAIGVACPAQC